MFFKKAKAPGHERDPRIPAIDGLHYYQTIRRLMETKKPEWYLEIGSRSGHSLAQCPSNFIAIDPEFALRHEVMNTSTQMLFFQQKSDDFFASNFLAKNDIKPDIAFIDGMHLFEFVLRDFTNCEQAMGSDGLICLHDVCPFNVPQTTRDLSYLAELKRPWTGDVWKIIPILQEYRPDLTVDVLAAAKTGFCVVSGLDRDNDVLRQHYDEICARYTDMSFEEFGPEKYYQSFQAVDPDEFLQKIPGN